MDFLAVLAIIFIIAIIMPKNSGIKKPISGIAANLIIENKVCPPHQWFWQQIVDQSGEKKGERMVCKICGPIASQSGKD